MFGNKKKKSAQQAAAARKRYQQQLQAMRQGTGSAEQDYFGMNAVSPLQGAYAPPAHPKAYDVQARGSARAPQRTQPPVHTPPHSAGQAPATRRTQPAHPAQGQQGAAEPHRKGTPRSAAGSHAPVFDQSTAAVPRPRRMGSGSSNEIILPMARTAVPQHMRRVPLTPQQLEEKRRRDEKKAKQRRRRRRIIGVSVALILIIAAVILSVSVLFKISSYVIEGESIYTREEIIAAFGMPKGNNLFGFSAADTEQEMADKLPYLQEVTVRRRLPSTVVIKVTAAVETYCVQTPTAWAVLSGSMRVLRLAAAQPADLTLLTGFVSVPNLAEGELFLDESAVQAQSTPPSSTAASDASQSTAEPAADGTGATLGESVSVSTAAAGSVTLADQRKALLALTEALSTTQLQPVSQINVADTLNVSFVYAGRIRVKLGTTNELEYKLKLASTVILQNLGENDGGTLDVSSRSADGQGQGIWRAGTI